MKTLQIGNVTLENNLVLGPMAGNRPAISSALQRAGRGTFVHGNGECQGHLLQQ